MKILWEWKREALLKIPKEMKIITITTYIWFLFQNIPLS